MGTWLKTPGAITNKCKGSQEWLSLKNKIPMETTSLIQGYEEWLHPVKINFPSEKVLKGWNDSYYFFVHVSVQIFQAVFSCSSIYDNLKTNQNTSMSGKTSEQINFGISVAEKKPTTTKWTKQNNKTQIKITNNSKKNLISNGVNNVLNQ